LPALLIAAVGCGGGGGGGESKSGGAASPPPAAASDKPAAKPDAGKSAAAVDPATAGSIKGAVKFTGTKPEALMIKMDADAYCKEQHPDPVPSDAVVIDKDGMVKWVFVYVKDGPIKGMSFPTPTDAILFDQKSCHYEPHVFGVMVNQPITVKNSDPILHNINCKPDPKGKNKGFNEAQQKQGMETTKKFTAPEPKIRIKCDVHSWMGAWCFVMDNPYFAVTNDAGAFEIKNLPPGDYTLGVWHEKFGDQEVKVKVDPKGTATANVEFKG
jgi:hypothetical protein